MKPTEMVQEVTAAIVAVITVGGALALTAFQVVNNQALSVPEWITLLIGAIVGAYFTRSASQNGARQAGTAAAQTAVTQLTTPGGGGSDGSGTATHS